MTSLFQLGEVKSNNKVDIKTVKKTQKKKDKLLIASMIIQLHFNLKTITKVVREEPNTENQPKYEEKG